MRALIWISEAQKCQYDLILIMDNSTGTILVIQPLIKHFRGLKNIRNVVNLPLGDIQSTQYRAQNREELKAAKFEKSTVWSTL